MTTSTETVDPTSVSTGEVEEQTYSKDYWDLVIEQLSRRQLFKVGMWILAVLYGLAIFAPLIGNDRPYKLVAIDYGSYDRAVGTLTPLTRAMGNRFAAATTPEALAEAAEDGLREVEALTVRAETMSLYLSDADSEAMAWFVPRVVDFQSRAASGEIAFGAPMEAAVAELTAEVSALADEFVAAPYGADESIVGKRLQPHTSYPLADGLGAASVGFMILWIVLVTFPTWNRIWNRVGLGGDRERIRATRRAKWAVLTGLPLGGALLWFFAVGGGAPAFDLSPYKAGLTDGSIVAVQAPIMAPIPIGYSETHKEEGFRPPTWLSSSRLDVDGRYVEGLRVPKADPVTGFLPPPAPVEVRFAEPWPNAPNRHLAGTDELGRDFMVRLLWGGRVSLAVGILSAVLLTVIGVVMGSVAGYFGGWVDIAIMRVIEILQSTPAFFLILASLSFIDPKKVGVPPIFVIVVVIALVRWTGAARLVRGEFLRLREQEFVLASRALGFSNRRTIFKHVLPNALGPVLVSAAFSVAAGILTESAVSYLGFGVQHPEASWGSLVNESKSAEFWWVQVFPGVLIFITVTCYNLVGDAVRDALDPKMKV